MSATPLLALALALSGTLTLAIIGRAIWTILHEHHPERAGPAQD